MWLCEEERRSAGNAEKGTFASWGWDGRSPREQDIEGGGYTAITARASRWTNGQGTEGDLEWASLVSFVPLTY